MFKLIYKYLTKKSDESLDARFWVQKSLLKKSLKLYLN